MSDSLVDFADGFVDSVLCLPDRQEKFFWHISEEIQITKASDEIIVLTSLITLVTNFQDY